MKILNVEINFGKPVDPLRQPVVASDGTVIEAVAVIKERAKEKLLREQKLAEGIQIVPGIRFRKPRSQG